MGLEKVGIAVEVEQVYPNKPFPKYKQTLHTLTSGKKTALPMLTTSYSPTCRIYDSIQRPKWQIGVTHLTSRWTTSSSWTPSHSWNHQEQNRVNCLLSKEWLLDITNSCRCKKLINLKSKLHGVCVVARRDSLLGFTWSGQEGKGASDKADVVLHSTVWRVVF